MRNFFGQALLALLLCNPNGISAFSTPSNHCSHSMALCAASSEVAEAKAAEAKTDKGTTKLELKGVVEIASSPLQSVSSEQMASFFESKELRDMLVTAGGKRPCEEIAATGDLLQQWKEACEVVGAQLPNENDFALSVKTGGISFPGLTLVSKANIGAKLIQEPSPRYEFVLIGDEQTVKGLPPVVWIYNKLTGSGDDGKESGGSTSTSSLSTITYETTESGKTIIKSNAFLSVAVSFPSILLKILPTNKEKAEESGGKAICKTLEKDIVASVEAAEKAYIKFLDEAN